MGVNLVHALKAWDGQHENQSQFENVKVNDGLRATAPACADGEQAKTAGRPRSRCHLSSSGTVRLSQCRNRPEGADKSLFVLPLVADGRVYLAHARHFALGWRYFSNWSVKINQRNGKNVRQIAMHVIGMTKGSCQGLT